jgi:hypothetical protein
MSVSPTRVALTRTGWIIYGIVEVALFLIANFTAKNASHPGTVSQIFFTTFIAGLVLAVALGVMTVVRQRRAER